MDRIVLLVDESSDDRNIIRVNTTPKDFADRRKRIILIIGIIVLSSLFLYASQTDIILSEERIYRIQNLISPISLTTQSNKSEEISSTVPSPTTSFVQTTIAPFASFTNSSDVCIHPQINPFDPEIMKFYSTSFKCTPNRKNITSFAAQKLINNEPKNFDCWGRCLWFESGKKNKEGDWYSTESNHSFECDIIEARCSKKGNNIQLATFNHMHTQIVEVKPSPTKIRVAGKLYNVYFITVDSHAYTQNLRNLPKTNEFLVKEMEAITFPYLNRQADRSRENAIPWWFGKTTERIDKSRYGLPSIEVEQKWEASVNCKRELDDDKMLIKEFAEYGYMTNLAEDWWGSMDYECSGFKKMVGHHTYLPYVIEYEHNKQLRNWLADKQCLHRHQHVIDYFSQYLQAYKGKLKMGWMWIVHIGHNNEWLSKELDPHLFEFFNKNKEELDNSFVFLGGDHGMRFTGAVKTRVGKLDVNNPLLMMMLPKELRNKTDLVNTIRENALELQTHFDTRATMLDILKFQPAANYEDRKQMDIPGELGHSFLRKQPKPRNCKTLPIHDQFCICESSLNVNLKERFPQRGNLVGERIIASINNKLKEHGIAEKCRKWNYTGIEQLNLVSEKPMSVEGIVLAHPEGLSPPKADAQFKVFGSGKDDSTVEATSLDRLDLYGSNGDCVSKSFRPICHCL